MNSDIGIVGVGLNLPGGCRTLDEVYDTLQHKKCHIKRLTHELSNFDSSLLINDVDLTLSSIDKEFNEDLHGLRINPKESLMMDVQQKLLLQCVSQAILDAGENIEALSESDTAVIVGCGEYDFREQLVCDVKNAIPYSITGSFSTFLANKISYYLNLSGPSFVVDSACSSSLVALVNAINLIDSDQCEAALVCGVNIVTNAFNMIAYHNAGLLSPDGNSRPFMRNSNGFIRAEGCIALYIKKIDIKDSQNKKIYAFVKGGAINHGGKSSSMIAPSKIRQVQLMKKAILHSDITVDDIDYFEMHCTGTTKGDKTEMDAICELLDQTSVSHNIFAGSIKGNFGHLEGAAGLLGVLKILAMMKHNKITPQIGDFDLMNADLKNAKVRVVFDKVIDWPKERKIAIVNSFGIGGTNASVVLQSGNESSKDDDIKSPDQTSDDKVGRKYLYERKSVKFVQSNKSIAHAKKIIGFGIDDIGIENSNLCCNKDYSSEFLIRETGTSLDIYFYFEHIAALDSIKERLSQCVKCLQTAAELSKHGNVRFFYVLHHSMVDRLGAVIGLLQSTILENRKLSGAVISIQDESLFSTVFQISSSRNINLIRIDHSGATVDLYCPVDIDNDNRVHSCIRCNGTYVIFGGTSGVGKEIANYLIKNYDASLILVGRRNVGANDLDSSRIKYEQCDVNEPENLQRFLKKLHDDRIDINGIFFSIPTIYDGVLTEISAYDFSELVFRKFQNLVLSANQIAKLRLDFFAFILSINGIVGTKGGSVYSAGNSQFDYSTKLFSDLFMTNVSSVDFGVWKDTGLAKRYAKVIEQSNIGLGEFSTLEGVTTLDNVLTKRISNALFFQGQNFCVRGHVVHAATIMLDLYAVLKFIILLRSKNHSIDLSRCLDFPEKYSLLKMALESILKYYNVWNLKHAFFSLTTPAVSLIAENVRNELLEYDPTYVGYVELLDHVSDNFYNILEGKCHYADVLFGGGFDRFERIYRGNTYYDQINDEVARSIVDTASLIGRKVKILEIGAGVGGTSSAVIQKLEEQGICFDYYYTDLSQGFLKYAKNRFQDKVITKILNIEDIGNFGERDFDIILASNVIHATSDIHRSVQNIKSLLAKKGRVYLVELASTAMVYTLIFGLTSGWWGYRDTELRIPCSPLLKKTSWFDLFVEVGLHPKFNRQDDVPDFLGNIMILCGENI